MSAALSDTAQTSFAWDELDARAIAQAVLFMPRAHALNYLERQMQRDIGPHARRTARRLYLNLTDNKE
ncbi:hypothetical protein CSC94_12600 [Zhengella mangrovi]|uniref:Uncharacterized protein n=1 Tax=Zhengella mangrovi TaxID=1982044 RepID=A0A2G1QLX8_9HYPH|nr:hypothetical protein [Zhengella mangrovi]PHP66526.1 hypothetical protein CSC94_12600 [Zhengella mangrovi]